MASFSSKATRKMMVTLTTLYGENIEEPEIDRQPTLRTDFVQSNDDTSKHILLETTSAPIKQSTDKSGDSTSVSTWNVIYPAEPKDFSSPIHGEPLYFLVFFYIKPECVDAFVDLLVEEAKLVDELEGDGNIRFDLYQNTIDSTEFVVLEVLRDREALAKHSAMPHFLKVREALWDVQAKPRSHDKGYRVISSWTASRAEELTRDGSADPSGQSQST